MRSDGEWAGWFLDKKQMRKMCGQRNFTRWIPDPRHRCHLPHKNLPRARPSAFSSFLSCSFPFAATPSPTGQCVHHHSRQTQLTATQCARLLPTMTSHSPFFPLGHHPLPLPHSPPRLRSLHSPHLRLPPSQARPTTPWRSALTSFLLHRALLCRPDCAQLWSPRGEAVAHPMRGREGLLRCLPHTMLINDGNVSPPPPPWPEPLD